MEKGGQFCLRGDTRGGGASKVPKETLTETGIKTK